MNCISSAIRNMILKIVDTNSSSMNLVQVYYQKKNDAKVLIKKV